VEFNLRKREGQGVVVGFIEEFHATGVGQVLKEFQDGGLVPGELFEGDSGNGEGDLEPAPMMADLLQQDIGGGQVARLGDPLKDGAIFFLIFIRVFPADIEEGIMAEADGLVDLEITTDGGHKELLS
jgi:hypothetical protein